MGNQCAINDYRQPRVNMLQSIFARACRETPQIAAILSEKRADAEADEYEDRDEDYKNL
jgi:hypothetical protein